MSSSRSSAVVNALSRPVVLVGLMGAGKSSVGWRLAAALSAPFFDSDTEIEAAAGMSIADVFERHGEASFRDGERRVIRRLLDGEPCVLATGGGVFVSEENRDLIAERALSVWIDADVETLWNRVKDRSTRPLLLTADPRGVLLGLWKGRRSAYAKADIRVESPPGITHENMVQRIVSALAARDRDDPARPPILRRDPSHE